MSDKGINDTGLARLIANIKANFATKDSATQNAAGLMSAADKQKLDAFVTLTDAEVTAILNTVSS